MLPSFLCLFAFPQRILWLRVGMGTGRELSDVTSSRLCKQRNERNSLAFKSLTTAERTHKTNESFTNWPRRFFLPSFSALIKRLFIGFAVRCNFSERPNVWGMENDYFHVLPVRRIALPERSEWWNNKNLINVSSGKTLSKNEPLKNLLINFPCVCLFDSRVEKSLRVWGIIRKFSQVCGREFDKTFVHFMNLWTISQRKLDIQNFHISLLLSVVLSGAYLLFLFVQVFHFDFVSFATSTMRSL